MDMKKEQQQKHYAYLSQLQNMARELPAWVFSVNYFPWIN